MTNLVYKQEWVRDIDLDKHIILQIEKEVTDKIINSCRPTDIFIHGLWLQIDEQLKSLSKTKHSRTFIFNGMDWETTVDRKEANDFIKNNFKNVEYLGNSNNEHYYGFWLYFISKFIDNFQTIPHSPKISKLFMNLNRKPHPHRVELFQGLKSSNLLEHGYFSLLGNKTRKTYLLEDDVSNIKGDEAHAGEPIPIPNDISSLGNLEYWNSHLINVVSETVTHSDVFLSEKSWKPILGGKLFMILGDFNTYGILKDYGIDTFDDILGTGYKEWNIEGRVKWIVDTLNKFKGKDYSKLHKILYPRLLNNRIQAFEAIKKNDNKLNEILNYIEKSR